MRTFLFRTVSIFVTFTTLNLSVPFGAIATFGSPVREAVEKHNQVERIKAKDIASRRLKSASRMLSGNEQRKMQGRAGENPYLAGQSKWDVVYKGVNVMTGNYSMSATDLSFEGGYGIPVNVTRSYSANDAGEGPFGKGWTLSADVRSTAGGVLKSGHAPVRSIPTSFKERNSLENDPALAVQPVEAVVAVDAGGKAETIQRDVDGILTTQPWDSNVIDSVYEEVVQNGITYRILKSNTVRTVDGTTYNYQKMGSYTGQGTQVWNNGTAAAEPANVLKITSATDRQGNVTTYTYGSGYVSFNKTDGATSEHPLTQVQMPNGHNIALNWGTAGNAANRVTSVSDNNAARAVTYSYNASHNLASVTTPAGRTTTYGYGSSYVPSGWSGSVASNLLTSITDPRGLTESVAYTMAVVSLPQFGGSTVGPAVYLVSHPNGWYTNYWIGTECTDNDFARGPTDPPQAVNYISGGQPGTNRTRFIQPVISKDSGANTVSVTIKSKGLDQENTQAYVGGLSPQVTHVYDAFSQNEVSTSNLVKASTTDNGNIVTDSQTGLTQTVNTATAYNFMGNPLTRTVTTFAGSTQTNTMVTSYAYWGADKYYQQKAVVDPALRASYTDYFDNNAAAGSKGQTYRVYRAADVLISPTTGTGWQNTIAPQVAGQWAAQFSYESKGRPTDVWKLQAYTQSGSWTRVQTHTTYGADQSPAWGQASTVTEDSGDATHINRLTRTQGYDTVGRANDVIDAAGHEFVTVRDGDGLVSSVTRVDGGLNQTIASYTYGTTAGTITNGAVTSVTDGLSGINQSISYASSGTGIGQPSTVTETNSGTSYVVSYTYDVNGHKSLVTYATPNGTTLWKYWGYITVGGYENVSDLPTRLTRMVNTTTPSAEEFYYEYDFSGRLRNACFAQTAQASSPTGNTYYGADSKSATSRAVAHYEYDELNRVVSLSHYWQTVSNGTVTGAEAIVANTCGYEVNTGLNRGLKTASNFYVGHGAGSSAFDLSRGETYGYDNSLDYLTTAHYGDGLAGADKTYLYDAAGNRTNTGILVDNLNRATASQDGARSSDILGNTTMITYSGGAQRQYDWDCLNRLLGKKNGSTVQASYTYRADGMRTVKYVASGNKTAAYRYDGQMGIEDVETSPGTSTVTDYAIGARGIDGISTNTNGTGATVSYPIYDAHGNSVLTLTKAGTNYYSTGNQRTYDAWGSIRAGAQQNDPKGRYCASLGHKADDETGFIYMRARYYEPSTARFLSEDPSHYGQNWFSYSNCDPVNYRDYSGRSPDVTPSDYFIGGALSCCVAILGLLMSGQALLEGNLVLSITLATISSAVLLIGISQYVLGLAGASGFGPQEREIVKAIASIAATASGLGGAIAVMKEGLKAIGGGSLLLGGVIVGAVTAAVSYNCLCIGALICIDLGI